MNTAKVVECAGGVERDSRAGLSWTQYTCIKASRRCCTGVHASTLRGGVLDGVQVAPDDRLPGVNCHCRRMVC